MAAIVTGLFLEADGRRRCEGRSCRGFDPEDALVTEAVVLGQELTLCCACWNLAGRPPAPARSESFAHVLETREKMLARGGADRYKVLSGKAGV